MSDRLTDDEIAELRHLHAIATDRALSAFTRSNALEKLINKVTWNDLARLLDEIEERRRAESPLDKELARQARAHRANPNQGGA